MKMDSVFMVRIIFIIKLYVCSPVEIYINQEYQTYLLRMNEQYLQDSFLFFLYNIFLIRLLEVQYLLSS